MHLTATARRGGVALTSLALIGALLLTFANTAGAVTEPKVILGAAGNYSVLAGPSVSNVGLTTMNENLGVSPGLAPAITGFPPGRVNLPGVKDQLHSAQSQLDLTAAFTDAASRTLTAIKGPDLSGLTLKGGVYHATARAALILPVNSTLTLDGEGDPNTVFVFQTDSTLTTFSNSHVNLINGAQECNVYWEVLSSANLGSNSTFVGNILALTTITMQDNVTVHGRALARNAGITLINDHFTAPTCATVLLPPTTTALPGAGAPTTTLPGGGGVTTSTVAGGGTGPTVPGGGPATTTTLGLTVGIVGPPRTGVAPLPSSKSFPWPALTLLGVAGAATTGFVVRRRLHAGDAPTIGR
jgi:hypothetical protein